jgi:hypothetical protein
MSTFLYCLAVQDSKLMVNERILANKAKAERKRREAQALRERQNEVEIAASAARPADALGTIRQEFDKINQRLSNVEKSTLSADRPLKRIRLSDLAASHGVPTNQLEKVESLRNPATKQQAKKHTSASESAAAAAKNQNGADTLTELSTKALKRRLEKIQNILVNRKQAHLAADTSLATTSALTGEADRGYGKTQSRQRNPNNPSIAGAEPGNGRDGKPSTQPGMARTRQFGAGRGNRGRGRGRGRG